MKERTEDTYRRSAHDHERDHGQGHDDHAHEHDHAHEDDHRHEHSAGCACGGHHGHSHDHSITFYDHEEDGVPLSHMLPPLLGIVGIILGFVARKADLPMYPVIFMAAAAIAGFPVAKAGFAGLLHGGGANINLLTTIAGAGALLLGEWAEGAAVLTLFSVGEYLEEKAGERARKSIRDVMSLTPKNARVKRGEDLVEIPAEKLIPGDLLLILPGEKIPADGLVIKGESAVNESHVTGEPLPADKVPGSTVYAASLNGEGPLEVQVTRAAGDTTVDRIIAMVEEAQSKRAKSQRLVDSFAGYWTPAMIVLSVAVGFLAPLVFSLEFRPWLYRGLTVLIVSCPCSLVISTPVTVVAGIATAARNGVLIKGGVHLEDLGKVRAVAFDKTGTITQGKMSVASVVVNETAEQPAEQPATQIAYKGKDRVLALAAAVEANSEHPLAKAIVLRANELGLDLPAAEGFESLRGKGAVAVTGGKKVYAGSPVLFEEAGISIPDALSHQAESARRDGQTVVIIGTEDSLLGFIGLSDAVRDESSAAFDRLRKQGVSLTMLTGDHHLTASAVATQVGMDSFDSGLLPEEKQQAIRALVNDYQYCAMVGDGVNDAPSLAAATVGIAVAGGAEVAMETADVALVKPDLRKIPWAIGLGRRSRQLILQNVAFSVALKIGALALVLGGILPLWVAVLADSGASVIVTLNGLRILSYVGE